MKSLNRHFRECGSIHPKVAHLSVPNMCIYICIIYVCIYTYIGVYIYIPIVTLMYQLNQVRMNPASSGIVRAVQT